LFGHTFKPYNINFRGVHQRAFAAPYDNYRLRGHSMSLVRIPTTGNQVTKHSTDYGWSQQSTELSFFLKRSHSEVVGGQAFGGMTSLDQSRSGLGIQSAR